MDLDDLVQLEAIRRLKYRYMRCVDLRLFDELAECFTEDATVSYNDGKWVRSGRDAIIELLRAGLPPEVLSSHLAYHPEIDLHGDTASATWALQDHVLNRRLNSTLHGAGYYTDEYRRVDGRWLISYTTYSRTFERRTSIDPAWEGAPG
jgi:hypothetical protein